LISAHFINRLSVLSLLIMLSSSCLGTNYTDTAIPACLLEHFHQTATPESTIDPASDPT